MVSSFLTWPLSKARRVISMSFGLSSTSRILNGASVVSILVFLLSGLPCRQARYGEKEGRPFAGGRLNPDVSSVRFDHFLADGQAHAGALVFLAVVQALEDLEDLFVVLRRYADAVVAHGEGEGTVLRAGADLDAWLRLIVVLYRVGNKILEDLAHARSVAGDGRHVRIDEQLDALLLQGEAEFETYVLDERAHGHRRLLEPRPADA